jgi:hypothetical protein
MIVPYLRHDDPYFRSIAVEALAPFSSISGISEALKHALASEQDPEARESMEEALARAGTA